MPINATVAGFLGEDPKTRNAGSSTVTELPIGSTDGFGDNKTTTWIRASVWGKQGEAAVRFFKKGDGIIATGRVVNREYEKKDGGKGYSLELQNATWDFPPVRKNEGGGSQQRREEPASETYNDEEIPF